MDNNVLTENSDLSGTIALVTGGSRGIGRTIAIELASAGATVAVSARSTSQLDETVSLIHASGGKALAFTVDVTDQIKENDLYMLRLNRLPYDSRQE